MKKFFEEYGFILVTVIVIVALILLVKNVNALSLQGKVESWIQDLTNSGNNVMSTLDSGIPETPEEKITIEGTMAKGNIVTLDGKEYRVLEMSDTQAKLLAMYDTIRRPYDLAGGETTVFNGRNGKQYANSNLDDYLENTFYPSLSFKNAIVPQTITQNMYEHDGTPANGSSWYKSGFTSSDTSGTNYTVTKTGSVSVGLRHCYILDIQDIIDYLGSTWTPQQLNTMLHNVDYAISGKSIWLRSAYYDYTYYAWYVGSNSGHIYGDDYFKEQVFVRPTFIIDLTKCEYTK